jgi:hypothetical protein
VPVRLEGLMGWWWTGDSATRRRERHLTHKSTTSKAGGDRSLTQRRHAVVR